MLSTTADVARITTPFGWARFNTDEGSFVRIKGTGIYQGIHMRTNSVSHVTSSFLSWYVSSGSGAINDPAFIRRVCRLIFVQKVRP